MLLKNRKVCTRHGARKGAAAVEFAVVLPIIVLVIVGTLEICNALNLLSAAQHAAREAARHSITPNATQRSTNEIALQALKANRVDQATINISPNPATAESGSILNVTIELNYGDNSILPTPSIFGNRKLSSTVAMRKE